MAAPKKTRALARRPPRDWGRTIAFVFSVLFSVIGAVPLLTGLLVRTSFVRGLAARETASLLENELGVQARYDVTVQAWPMMVGLDNLVVDASDGGPPFLEVERVAVRPRLFSLLSGKLDAGDIEIIGPRLRPVVEGGEIKNLRLTLPEASPGAKTTDERAPLSSVTITDARIDALIEGVRVVSREVDVDLTAEEDGAYEIALRTGPTRIERTHPIPGREGEDAVDEDVICRLDTRVRYAPDSVLIRRLTLQGAADFDPDPGTSPPCDLAEDDWRSVDVRLGALRVTGLKQGPIGANGRVKVRLPVPVVHRFAEVPNATGSVFADVEVDYDGRPGLPRVTGRIELASPGIDGKVFSKRFRGDLGIASNVVRVEHVVAEWGDGEVHIGEVKIEPLAKGVPITAGPIDIKGVEFPGLLRDLGVDPTAHVAWSLYDGHLDSFKGTLNPPGLEGYINLKTRNFEIFDKPTADPQRGHMMGVKESVIHGLFQVRPHGIVLSNFEINTPLSRVKTDVELRFESKLDIQIHEGTEIDLSELSPLTTLPIAGKATVKASARGPFTDPSVEGDVAIKGFEFAGFSAGDVESAKVSFKPMILKINDARIRKNESRIRVTAARLDFERPQGVVVDADIDTREGPHLALKDFFEIFHFEKDPRFKELAGIASGVARVHFALGGPEDRCGEGYLSVRTDMRLSKVEALGERFDDGHLDMDLIWDDKAAGANGMRMELREGSLRKGSGSILATGGFRHGGALQISAIASGIPIDRIDTLGAYGKLFVGSISGVVTVGGTFSAMTADADVRVSRIRVGAATLPSSELRVALEPSPTPPRVLGVTRCGNLKLPEFDPAEYERDLPDGEFRTSGEMFGGQVVLEDLRTTRQRRKVASGKIHIKELNLGTIANVIPGVAFTGSPPSGQLTASIDIASLPLDKLDKADVTLKLDSFTLERGGQRVRLMRPSGPIWLVENEIGVPELQVEARAASGLSGVLRVGGEIRKVMTQPDLDLTLAIDPIDLSKLAADIPALERASGVLDAKLRVTGPPADVALSGSAKLREGSMRIEGSPLALDDVDVDIDIGGGEVRLKKASARVGGGALEATGRMGVQGLELGAASFDITARGVKIPVADGINLTADADLEAAWSPGATEGERNLPSVKGTVSLTSFSYTRPIAMSVSLGQLTGRGQRTEVKTYDPNDDFVRFSLNVVSPRPLRFQNNLVNMQLEVVQPGLALSGTNQRFGARGLLRILPDSKLTLRSSEFDVREGYVRFDDPERIAPKVDVRASTEYRRYAKSTDSASSAGAAPDAPASASIAAATASQSGNWRINLHAHGDAEDLKVNLTSDPPLGQEDIVLLLTIGMTRAEIDRGLATSLGETVGLEALSALTGADTAVKTIVPIIDEFRFGTGYSSRTGRTEPTVTVGKRVTDGVRASVTTGLTENREVRSSVEWRLGRRMSVQGSYDNANDASSSLLGNIGVDLRWRLEFE